MIQAVYSDGHKYQCQNLWGLNLGLFVVDGLVELTAGRFVLDRQVHGYPLFHFCRTVLSGSNKVLGRVYVLVTDRFKIFVDHNGNVEIRTDWIQGHALYGEGKPGVIRPAWVTFGQAP